jgi:hypothetical protein
MSPSADGAAAGVAVAVGLNWALLVWWGGARALLADQARSRFHLPSMPRPPILADPRNKPVHACAVLKLRIRHWTEIITSQYV